MKLLNKILLGTLLIFQLSFSATIGSTTQLLDQAQQAIKEAFEAGCPKHTPYEYYKAEAYYQVAKNEASLLNLDTSRAASLKAMEWALKAITKRFNDEIIKERNGK
jgi:hypothetical protein